MIERFIQFFKDRNLLQTGRFILAVSGGMDSVVLCTLCREAGLHFAIAHCNFQLRGEESKRDELFVRELAATCGAELFVKTFNTEKYALENKISIQEAARDLRYQWFYEIIKEKNFTAVLIAHHADDNLETLLMNFFRGTGLQGLTGIRTEDETGSFILRPLLIFRRSELAAFATEHYLKWVEDSSNSSVKYTRNYFRGELIPSIKKVYPGVEENLLNNIERFRKINTFYRLALTDFKNKLCVAEGKAIKIPVKKLLGYKDTSLPFELIKDFGFNEKQVPELFKLAYAESGKFIENDQYQIIKHRNWLIIAPRTKESETIAIHQNTSEVIFNGGILNFKEFRKDKHQLKMNEYIAELDARLLEYPILLRKWKPGDYFYPFGLGKKKKISRFFIDQKMSRDKKENTWILTSGDRVIWIVGMRIDDRFRINPSTKNVIEITWTSL